MKSADEVSIYAKKDILNPALFPTAGAGTMCQKWHNKKYPQRNFWEQRAEYARQMTENRRNANIQGGLTDMFRGAAAPR
jgi:hypothetical protein